MDIVCVTGASGFIAQHIVKKLVESGVIVHATVRNMKNEVKNRFLLDIQNKHPENIKIFEADLLKEGSFDDAIKEAHHVIHTASPFLLAKHVKDPEQDLILPACKGTENVLKSVLKFKDTVKKVVLTSSIAACTSPFGAEPDSVITESNWNTTSTMQEPAGPYRMSKTRAEKFAWEFCDKYGINLTTICPTLVIGQVLNSNIPMEELNTSAVMCSDILHGKTLALSKMNLGFVDVRDVAEAHILGMSEKVNNHRFIISALRMNWVEFADYAKKYDKEFPNMTKDVDPKEFPSYSIDVSKSQQLLSLKYHSKEEMIDSMIESIRKSE